MRAFAGCGITSPAMLKFLLSCFLQNCPALLKDTLAWFFFQLLLLNYVEDKKSGESFSLLKGIEWQIYIEVSSIFTRLSFCELLVTVGTYLK